MSLTILILTIILVVWISKVMIQPNHLKDQSQLITVFIMFILWRYMVKHNKQEAIMLQQDNITIDV